MRFFPESKDYEIKELKESLNGESIVAEEPIFKDEDEIFIRTRARTPVH